MNQPNVRSLVRGIVPMALLAAAATLSAETLVYRSTLVVNQNDTVTVQMMSKEPDEYRGSGRIRIQQGGWEGLLTNKDNVAPFKLSGARSYTILFEAENGNQDFFRRLSVKTERNGKPHASGFINCGLDRPGGKWQFVLRDPLDPVAKKEWEQAGLTIILH